MKLILEHQDVNLSKSNTMKVRETTTKKEEKVNIRKLRLKRRNWKRKSKPGCAVKKSQLTKFVTKQKMSSQLLNCAPELKQKF